MHVVATCGGDVAGSNLVQRSDGGGVYLNTVAAVANVGCHGTVVTERAKSAALFTLTVSKRMRGVCFARHAKQADSVLRDSVIESDDVQFMADALDLLCHLGSERTIRRLWKSCEYLGHYMR